MSCGRPNPVQVACIRKFVEGRIVSDLGAGDLLLSHLCAVLGATKVIAIDKETMPEADISLPIEQVRCAFRYYKRNIDVALLSWPINTSCGLEALVNRAEIVIYLGKCTDGTICGTPRLWSHLVRREVLLLSPDRTNTLIVYGPSRVERALLLEEHAGLDDNNWYTYGES